VTRETYEAIIIR